jgi:hypothetical protein
MPITHSPWVEPLHTNNPAHLFGLGPISLAVCVLLYYIAVPTPFLAICAIVLSKIFKDSYKKCSNSFLDFFDES